MEALNTLKFTEDSGIGGAICYMSDGVELTELHVRLIVEAKSMTESGEYDVDRVHWWDAGKYF